MQKYSDKKGYFREGKRIWILGYESSVVHKIKHFLGKLFFVIRNYVLIHMNLSVGQKRMVNTAFKKKNILMGEWKVFVTNSIWKVEKTKSASGSTAMTLSQLRQLYNQSFPKECEPALALQLAHN